MENSKYIESKAKETGMILANLKNLGHNMDKGFEDINCRIERLGCAENKQKVNLLFAWYEDNREFKKEIFKTSLKIISPMFLACLGLVAAAYASLTQ